MENLDKRRTSFLTDLLKYGKTGEKDIANFFKSRGYTIGKPNNDSKYDFDATKKNKTLTVEVKADYKCITPTIKGLPTKDTGNIFVEYQSWGKAGGIAATEADVFTYMYGALKPRQLWLISVEDLKELIEDNNFPTTENSGDEGSDTEGYLIPRWKHFYSFVVYKEIDGIWQIQKTPQN